MQDSFVGSWYKYWTPAIVKDTQSIKYKLLTFSASRVDLGEFFSVQGCIGPADLRLIYKYRHGLYFYLYGCIDPVDLHSDSGIS